MTIDISKLEQVKNKKHKIIARCPACAQSGHDQKGNHLIIDNRGRFACIMYPGLSGRDHRRLIFKLAGKKEPVKKWINIKKVSQASQTGIRVKINDVLGRIGRHFQSPYKKTIRPLNELEPLIKSYSEIMEKREKLRKEKTETDIYQSKKNYLSSIENTFSIKWKRLSEDKRKKLVDVLLEKELLPELVKKVLNIFDEGKVISII